MSGGGLARVADPREVVVDESIGRSPARVAQLSAVQVLYAQLDHGELAIAVGDVLVTPRGYEWAGRMVEVEGDLKCMQVGGRGLSRHR